MSSIRDYLEANPELAELSAEDLRKHLEGEGFNDVVVDAEAIFAELDRRNNKADSKVEQFIEDSRMGHV